MADHGENYKRMTDAEGNEIGQLGPECGHHCGVITVGHDTGHVGHCGCLECHADDISELPRSFTNESGGVDPRGIV